MTFSKDGCVESVRKSNSWIRANLEAFIKSEDLKKGSFHLGAAIHTIQDFNSPEHGFKEWHEEDGIEHAVKETIDGRLNNSAINNSLKRTSSFMNKAVNLRNAYKTKPNAVLKYINSYTYFDSRKICGCNGGGAW